MFENRGLEVRVPVGEELSLVLLQLFGHRGTQRTWKSGSLPFSCSSIHSAALGEFWEILGDDYWSMTTAPQFPTTVALELVDSWVQFFLQAKLFCLCSVIALECSV